MNTSYLANEQPQIAHSPVFGALPAPNNSFRVPDFIQKHRERERVPAQYNGRNIVTLYPDKTGTWSDR